MFGLEAGRSISPFLRLDAFDVKNKEINYRKGFPFQAQRGVYGITYVMGQDRKNSKPACRKTIFTANTGETASQEENETEAQGIQLWLNIPKKYQLMSPFSSVNSAEVPCIQREGVNIRIIAGQYNNVQGPVMGDFAKLLFFDVEMEAGSHWQINTPGNETVFIYMVDGEASFEEKGGNDIIPKHAVSFKKGEKMCVKANAAGARFLFVCALPSGDPVLWSGPIVAEGNGHDDDVTFALEDLAAELFDDDETA